MCVIKLFILGVRFCNAKISYKFNNCDAILFTLNNS